jgi:arylsulfatase
MKRIILSLVFMLILSDLTNAQNKSGDKKPNIVFIQMDNLGYGELGCYGGGIIRGAPTRRIDNLKLTPIVRSSLG